MSTTKGRRSAVGIVSVIAAMGLALVALVGGQASASTRAHRLAGTFDFRLGTSPNCTDPGCAVAEFRGVVRGPAEGPTTAIFPAEPPSNLSGQGTLVIHTARGDLNIAGSSVFNPDPASDGEIVFMFKIVGGTGSLAGASGYMMSAATAEVPGVALTNARYTGKLVLP